MSELSNSGTGDRSVKSVNPCLGQHKGSKDDLNESSGVDIKKEPDELACGLYGSYEPHPSIDAHDQLTTANFKTGLDSIDQFSSNIKTEVDSAEGDAHEPDRDPPRDLGEVKVKCEPADDYGFEPGSRSDELEEVGTDLGPVPLNLIPAARSQGLLRIDIEDPLHPVPRGGRVKEESLEGDIEESLSGFDGDAASDDQNMEDDETVSTFDYNSEIKSKRQRKEAFCSFISLSRKNKSAVENKSYVCGLCGQLFIKKSHLAQHERIHTGERPFRCDQCNKAFNTHSNLVQHKRIHSGERPFACDQCDKTFTQSNHLLHHRYIHTGERPFKCDQCDKTFTTKGNLVKHTRIHSGERPFACDECDKMFTQRVHLNQHKTIHTCGKTFTESGFEQHIHTGERPCSCDKCDETFTQKSNLDEHKLICHSLERPLS